MNIGGDRIEGLFPSTTVGVPIDFLKFMDSVLFILGGFF